MSAPIVDNSRSPHARLQGVPVDAVRLNDRFWEPRCALNRTVTLQSQLEHCEATGRVDNFRRASGKRKDLPFQGLVFNDSDVYKLLEAIAFSLGTHADPDLEAKTDALIAEVAAAQCENGYLNTAFMYEKEPDRWVNLKDWHEIYCAGHLIQAAVAHFRGTGKRSLLDVAVKYADYINDLFGPNGESGACGHPEIEMALVELSRTTNDPKYTALAMRMVDARGAKPGVITNRGDEGNRRYMQDHIPYRELSEVTGHAVRMLYLAAGAADLTAEFDDSALSDAMNRQWKNFTKRRMYVSGGAGSRYEGEAFGADYELPNDRAYTETCAAIASVMWNWRLLQMTADPKHADLIEWTLYNAVLPGLSLDGKRYFYENPLENDGTHRRQEWFGCACCPPNVARTLSSLTGYFASVSDEGAWLHLYAKGEASLDLKDGEKLDLEIETDYPWSGDVEIRVISSPSGAGSLFLRIPAWASGASAMINGVASSVSPEPGTYLKLPMPATGDAIKLTLPMPIVRHHSHPFVSSNRGQAAVSRGPILYCVENADFDGKDVRNLILPVDAELSPVHRPDLLGGVTVLTGDARIVDPASWDGELYQNQALELPAESISFTAVPYYSWANREAGAMRVWLPTL